MFGIQSDFASFKENKSLQMVAFFSSAAAAQNRKTKCAAVTERLARGSLPKEIWGASLRNYLVVCSVFFFYLLLWSTEAPWELGQWVMGICCLFLFVVWRSSCPVLCNTIQILSSVLRRQMCSFSRAFVKTEYLHKTLTIFGFNWDWKVGFFPFSFVSSDLIPQWFNK